VALAGLQELFDQKVLPQIMEQMAAILQLIR
jgi:hypothetical protein